MKAITVQQPWAWAIVHGGKDIENRTRLSAWKSAAGSRIAIHAGKRWSDRGAVIVPDITGRLLDDETIMFGALIGTVDVTDVHWEQDRCCDPWGEESYLEHGGAIRHSIVHLVLENPRPCPPIDCRGALGLWRVPDHAARELEAVTR